MKNFIIEGMDRCGKDTLIQKLLDVFAHQNKVYSVIHYGKPYGDNPLYIQNRNFRTLFSTLQQNEIFKSKLGIIANRAHIGEAVYAPLYRHYDGDYVFDIETEYENLGIFEDLYLIVLVDSNIEALRARSDGLNFSDDEEALKNEYNRFKRACEMSHIKHKLFIDIHDKTIQNVFDLVNGYCGLYE